MTQTADPARSSPAAGAVLAPDDAASARSRYHRMAAVMGCGIFATTFCQVQVLGLYPFRHLFNELSTTRLALFTGLATLPWNVKVFAGLVVDAFPIFGTRRRHYLLIAATLAAVLWATVGLTPPRYWPLLLMVMTMNCALVFASTVSGGLLVEAGQTFGATGRLSSLRVVLMNLALFGMPLGAFLAAQPLAATAGVAVIPLATLALLTAFFLREPRTARRQENAARALFAQLKACVRSRVLWAAAGLLFAVQFAPGFFTPLYKYQTKTLHFDEKFIGVLTTIDAIFGALGAAAYALFCRRWSLRTLLYCSIVGMAGTTLLYMGYNGWKSALVIEGAYYFAFSLAQLPLYDLAVRATPKGSEALGYAVILSAWNWGLFGSDLIGSRIFDLAIQHTSMASAFKYMVWINAGTTALVLVALPFLPRLLLNSREGENLQPPAQAQP